MQVRNVTRKEMFRALRIANKEWFEGNLRFATLEPDRFTLGVVDASGPGGRLGTRKKDGTRRLVPFKACWHAHGRFFEVLFGVAPRARISSKVGDINGPTMADGNWRDHPIVGENAWFSDLCECGRGVLAPFRAPRHHKLTLRRSEAMRPDGLLRRIS